MIFVIIGVVILVASFFIALASLIREQDKVEQSPSIDNVTVNNKPKIINGDLNSFSANAKSGDEDVGDKLNVGTSRSIKKSNTADTVPLPWDIDEKGDEQVKNDEDFEEIERIKASLRMLTGKEVSEDINEKNDKENKTKVESSGKIISGEFSLQEELRKRRNSSF